MSSVSPLSGYAVTKRCRSNALFPREQVIHSPAQLVAEYGQRCGFAVLVFEGGKIVFSRLALPEKEHGGFGKRPAQMDVADLFAGRP